MHPGGVTAIAEIVWLYGNPLSAFGSVVLDVDLETSLNDFYVVERTGRIITILGAMIYRKFIPIIRWYHVVAITKLHDSFSSSARYKGTIGWCWKISGYLKVHYALQ